MINSLGFKCGLRLNRHGASDALGSRWSIRRIQKLGRHFIFVNGDKNGARRISIFISIGGMGWRGTILMDQGRRSTTIIGRGRWGEF